MTNSKYSEKNSPFICKNFEISHSLLYTSSNTDSHPLFQHKATLAIKLRFHFTYPCQMAIIHKKTIHFLLGCMKKGTLYTVIGNVNKCHHYGYQYGGSSKIKNKTKNSST
jgi:hypothetical protein